MNRTTRTSLSLALVLALAGGAALPALAKEVRSKARSSVNSNKNVNVNRNKNVNRNTNVNVDRDIDIDVDHHHHGGYYGGCCYHGGVGTAMAVTATAMVTAAVIGSVVNTLPPSCTTVIVNGFAYQQCGSTWYQPQIAGSSTTYIVVNPRGRRWSCWRPAGRFRPPAPCPGRAGGRRYALRPLPEGKK